MSANVLDRTREFGVMRAIGARPPGVVGRIVVSEGLFPRPHQLGRGRTSGAGAVADPAAAQERDRRLCEELTAGPVELIRLTELGTRAVRQRLPTAGRDAPLVGELDQAPTVGLLGVPAEDCDPDAARAEHARPSGASGGKSVTRSSMSTIRPSGP